MNEMQTHGLLIPVGSKPFEVWIDKNNSLAELQDLVNGEGNHDDSGSDIGNLRPFDREYPIGH